MDIRANNSQKPDLTVDKQSVELVQGDRRKWSVTDVIDVFMNYAPEQSDSLLPERSPIRRWLSNHPAAWRVSRNDDFRTSPTQAAVLVIGEEGVGKSTALKEQAAVLRDTPGTHVLQIDFSHAYQIQEAVEHGTQEFQRALSEQLHEQIDPQFNTKELFDAYLATFYRLLLKKGPNRDSRLTQLRRKWGIDGFDAMSDQEILGNEEIDRICSHAYTHVSDRGFTALRVAQAIAGLQIIVQIDNVDHLPQHLIAETMARISMEMRSDTICHIALRPENEKYYPQFRQLRETRVIRIEHDHMWARIVGTRLDGIRQYVRHNPSIALPDVSADEDLVRSEVRSIQAEESALTLLESWHNENVRHMLSFTARLPQYRREHPEMSPTSIVYHHAVREAMPDYLEKIFSTRRFTAKKYPSLPFYFLNLRILSYLHGHPAGSPPLRSRVISDFQDAFGLPTHQIEQALDDMTGMAGNSGASLRLRERPRSGDDPSFDPEVILLPAGRVFIDQVVFSCDFLAYICDRTPGVSTPVRGGRSQQKFDMAVTFLHRKLLPAFFREHPYMQPGRGITLEERERLGEYVRLFNYGPSTWFLGRLVNSLSAYADKRNLETDQFSPLRRRVTGMLGQLDMYIRDEA